MPAGPPSTRLTDNCTGHGCFPPRPIASASPDSFVNNLNQGRLSDPYEAHGCVVCVPHGGMIAKGSSTVFTNNLETGRQGDPVDCGGAADIHSPDTYIGG